MTLKFKVTRCLYKVTDSAIELHDPRNRKNKKKGIALTCIARDKKVQIVRLRDLDGQGPDKITREDHASGWYSIDFFEPRNYRNKTKIIDLAFIVPDIYVFDYF